MTDQTKWTNEQWEAITAKDCNLLVAAAAGAGKTAVLVERIIQRITDNDDPVDIDRLLVVTFTNAAAAEMRERIAEALAVVLESNPGSSNMQKQLTLLSKASITTIHSFCLEVIRSNFQAINIDPSFRIADETETMLMKMEVLNDLFDEMYEENAENHDFLELLECYGGNRDDQALQDMVLNLHTFIQSSPWPEKWLAEMTGRFGMSEGTDFSQTSWGKILLKSIGLEIEGLIQNMQAAVALLQPGTGLDKYRPIFEEEYCFLQHIRELCLEERNARWDDLAQTVRNYPFQRLPSAGKDADKAVQEQVKEIRDQVKKKIGKLKERALAADSADIRADLQTLRPLMQCLSRLVVEFERRYALKKNGKSLVDFNDLEHFCLEILTVQDETGAYVPSEAAKRYQERFAEVLVDEYQDSNLVQEILLQMISRTGSARPNVFMVGDVKQSIYRFRQAKPELFLEKYHSYSPEQGASHRKICLYKNFRSRREVVDAVNYIFRQIMSVQVGELDYNLNEALNSGAVFAENDQEQLTVGGSVEFHLIQTGDPERLDQGNGFSDSSGLEEQELTESADTSNSLSDETEQIDPDMLDAIQCEARFTVRRIQELFHPNEKGRRTAVYDKESKTYRELRCSDIVILLRTTRNWSEVFTEELTAAGIPAFADTGTGFFKSSEVQVILSLLQIIDNPLQDIPLLAVLRSPLAAFSSDELAGLRLSRRHVPIYEALKQLVEETAEEDTPEPENGKPDNELQSSKPEIKFQDQLADGKSEIEKMNNEIPEKETLRKKAAMFLSKLHRWRDTAQYLSADRLLWRLYTETGYYGIVGAMPGGVQRQANLRILFERARQYEETSFKGLFNFINFIDKLKSNQGDFGSAKILGENDNVVRIMSIHKSKGLEFPVVILAGCGKKFNFQDLNRSILFHQELGLGPDVADPRLRIAYPSVPKYAIREQIRMETLSEEMRILYVALTRAREKLIISGAVSNARKALNKWSKATAGDPEKLPAYEVFKGEKYLDWIGPALIKYRGCSTATRAGWLGYPTDVTEGASGNGLLDDPSEWQIRMWTKNELLGRSAVQEKEEETFIRWLASLHQETEDHGDTEVNDDNNDNNDSRDNRDNNDSDSDRLHRRDVKKEIARRLGWEYTFTASTRIPPKVSVTELKRRLEAELSEETGLGLANGSASLPQLIKKPLFLEEKKGLNAAEVGTILHFVMQHLDVQRNDIPNQIQEMVKKELLTEQQAESVDPEKIMFFLESPLGCRMKASGSVNREVRFNIEIPCREVFSDMAAGVCGQEVVLLQGIIDCYFEEEDGIVLVDYKTDQIPEGGSRIILERYRQQILYYARALEMLTGKKVKEKYFYLFSCGEVLQS
ncbi:MAG: AAA family ATPase [Dehalobacter sp. 4CP]|uniref:UvrD-helicase domain-containing protein n=1 Tax=Dehalobacter sp. CP TaxID=2594474 RepID=UPI0013CAD016|nr:AAA family ATPase [Dehalobacter sp. 4CP]